MSNDYWSEWVDRPRGVLTKTERKHLLGRLGEEEKNGTSGNAAAQREYRIRKHLQHALLDFSILAEHVNEDPIRDAFTTGDDWDPVPALPELVSFLYQYCGSERQLARLVEEGVERVRREEGDPVKARVSIDLFLNELDEIEDRFDEGGVDAVDDRELEDLWRDGRLTDDEYLSLVEEWEEHWHDDREDWIERDGPRRRVVHGALELAKRKVELAQQQAASREEFLEASGVDHDDVDDEE